MFTFGKIPLGMVWTPLSSQLWVKLYHYCSSRRMDLALNNPRRFICHSITSKQVGNIFSFFENFAFHNFRLESSNNRYSRNIWMSWFTYCDKSVTIFSYMLYIYMYIYIYIYIERERERGREREKLKNKGIQKKEFIVKESQYNVSVLMNLHQDLNGWYRMTLNHWWIF